MLVVETVVQIRREHASAKAIKAIAWDLRLSRKVVRKPTRAPVGAFGYYRTVHRLGPFQEWLDRLLTKNDARHRPRSAADDAVPCPVALRRVEGPLWRGPALGESAPQGCRCEFNGACQPSARSCSSPPTPTGSTGATRM